MNTIHNNATLFELLLDTGLIVFGNFIEEDQRVPYQVNLEYLSSYPSLMRRCVSEFVTLNRPYFAEFLASHRFGVPFASLVANEIGSRHVYTFDVKQTFVGSYDVGHDTTLIMLSYEGSVVDQLRSLGMKAGLNITDTLCLFSPKPINNHRSLLYLVDIVNHARSMQLISDNQANTVHDFIHHRG